MRVVNRRGFLTGAGLACTAAAAIGTGGCGPKTDRGLRLALNWKPDPQFGGFYAADYATYGLQAELLPGGAGTPTVQMIGSGAAEFGIVSADEIVLARARGNNVIGLFAVYQNCPQGIMVHAARALKDIGDVTKGGTLAIQRGLPYARLLERKYGFEHVRVVPSPGGDISAFLNDKDFAQQCFVVSEPLAARKKGVAVSVFPVGDTGYNPYTGVLAVSESYLQNNAATAKNLVDAVRGGWQIYLRDPAATNARMNRLNPSMDLNTFAEVAAAQKPYIEASGQIGIMTADRWAALSRQLRELGDIPTEPKPEDCFRSL